MGPRTEKGQRIDLLQLGKREMRAQFAALCWRRREERIEVLLVTTRETGRWVIPKGWPGQDRTPAECAALEAFEEAGVRGIGSERCVGIFTYVKEMPDDDLPVVVAVFPVEVSQLLDEWPEMTERTRRWAPLKKAARIVSDPGLRRLLSDPSLPKFLR